MSTRPVPNTPAPGIQVKYAWVDTDGDQVSPTHERMTPALRWIQGWTYRWNRLHRELDLMPDRHSTRRAISMLTKTGKPPVQLKRVVIHVSLEPLMGEEQLVADQVMKDEL